MKGSLLLYLFINVHLLFGQRENLFYKGQSGITVGFSVVPINKKNSQVDFKYVDGNQNSNYLIDTISTSYKLNKSYFGNALNIGFGYFVTDQLKASIQLKPYLNSFLSNKAKNENVYGVQFDVGLDYFYTISEMLAVSFGSTASRIIGGFGITSGGAENKEYLVVNENQLYDDDIGFHIIDNS